MQMTWLPGLGESCRRVLSWSASGIVIRLRSRRKRTPKSRSVNVRYEAQTFQLLLRVNGV
jgi:hypothetical protein